MSDYMSSERYDVERIKSYIRPWMDKEGNPRYYVDVPHLVNAYRDDTDTHLRGHWDYWEGANGARVRECIEANIIPKTKAYFDGDGFLHVYGYATVGKGEQMGLPEYIEKCASLFYGVASEEERAKRAERLVGKSGFSDSNSPDVGDTVEIFKGRKEVGKTFVIARMTRYSFSVYRPPSIYFHDSEGFKVSADNCRIVDVGNSKGYFLY